MATTSNHGLRLLEAGSGELRVLPRVIRVHPFSCLGIDPDRVVWNDEGQPPGLAMAASLWRADPRGDCGDCPGCLACRGDDGLWVSVTQEAVAGLRGLAGP